MPVTKQGDKYKLDFYPDGRKGKRVVRLFKTKQKALNYQKDYLSGRIQQAVRLDDRRLSEFIVLWYDLHGQSLKSVTVTKNSLNYLSNYLGNPVLRTFSIESYAKYRQARLESGLSEATLNRELVVLKSMYSELKRLGVIEFDFPLLNVRKLKEKKFELSYLTQDQIIKLLEQVKITTNESLPYLVDISLSTGARWSECQNLTAENVHNGGFYFTDTKNGSSRFVPVDHDLFNAVRARLLQAPFKSCYSAFRSAFKRSGLTLPKGQLAHVLRHTFASHFIMSGGNVLALQKILGHSSLTITMRYSHLAPNYLNQAVTLNPLQLIKCSKNVVMGR